MSLRTLVIASLFLANAGLAQEQAPAFNGDAKRGKDLAYTCNGCHAIPNYKNVYPTYSVPKLHGQRPQYLLAALKAYKSGERSHGTMHSHAASLNEQDMADVAAYLAGPAVLAETKTDAALTDQEAAKAKKDARAELLAKNLVTCQACHGTNGVGITPDYPTISGQHRDYIVRALTDYKNGSRKNVVMAGMAANLTAQDIEVLATHYSSQKPALDVLPKRSWFLSAK